MREFKKGDKVVRIVDNDILIRGRVYTVVDVWVDNFLELEGFEKSQYDSCGFRLEGTDVRDLFKKPFTYDNYGQKVFDADNNLVADIRGWGYLSKVASDENAIKAQDNLGEEIVAMLNGW